MFDTAEFVKVATKQQLTPGSMMGAKVGDKEVLVANIDGRFCAIGNLCTHRQGVLSNGRLEGNVVTCPRHGSRFDVTTGKNLAGPKVIGVRLSTGDEPAYEVKVDGDDILVRLG